MLSFPSLTTAATQTFNITATSSSFSPSSVSIDKGNEVTLNFSVPSDDSYCCGLEVRSSKFSKVTINKGGSGSVTFTADSSFTFSSYWPSSSVHKADGTVTVKTIVEVPSVPEPPTPPPAEDDGDEVSSPTITKVSPSKFKQKTSGTIKITIIGTGFETGIKVKVGKVTAKSVTSPTTGKLSAVIPRKNLKPGKHSITVINQDGGKAVKRKAVTIVP